MPGAILQSFRHSPLSIHCKLNCPHQHGSAFCGARHGRKSVRGAARCAKALLCADAITGVVVGTSQLYPRLTPYASFYCGLSGRVFVATTEPTTNHDDNPF
jgi:hypothetical protein